MLRSDWKLRIRLAALLCVVIFLMLGCGSGSNDDNLFPGARGASVSLRLPAEALDNAAVDTLLVTGYDENGNVVFGPIAVSKSSPLALQGVPSGTRTLQILYNDGSITVGVSNVAISVGEGESVDLGVLTFQPGQSTVTVTPPATTQTTSVTVTPPPVTTTVTVTVTPSSTVTTTTTTTAPPPTI